jgi:NTE family protein
MRRALALVLLALMLAACARPNRYDDLEVVSLEQLRTKVEKSAGQAPRLGIAFGGGGVRGFVHLGVMRALEEARIRAAVVAGTSAGAAAAALYASGLPYSEIKARVFAAREITLADPVLSTRGILNGQEFAAWTRAATGANRFADLALPLAVTVADLTSGESLLVVGGDVGAAVQASASVPGSVIPVESGTRTLIDGGVLSLVPVRAARALGADVVIAIDIYCGSPPALKGHAIDTMLRTFRLQSCAISARETAEADLLIRPAHEPAGLVDAMHFGGRNAAIEAGYQATQAIIPALRERLKR